MSSCDKPTNYNSIRPSSLHSTTRLSQAVDLLLETGSLPLLLAPGAVDAASHGRVCLYLLKCADYLGVPEESATCIETAFKLFLAHGQCTDALRVALRRGGAREVVNEKLRAVFAAAPDASVKRQLAYMLGRHRVNFSTHDDGEGVEVDVTV